MTAPLLEVRDLSTWFETGRGRVLALDGVSLVIEDNESLGIVGESGSGKSVLARSIMGALPPHAGTRGSVWWEGREQAGLPPAERRQRWGREMSMVFQDPSRALNPVVRIDRQITESLRAHLGLDRRAARERARQLLVEVGIPDADRRLRDHPHQLSGGMRQRVCIAVALACGPRLLFADEPTTALDVTIQRQILDLLGDLRRASGMAMLLITHDLGVVARHTDRVMVMYGGQVMESATTTALFSRPSHPYTRALLASIPRLDVPSHTRIASIQGRPVDVLAGARGCRFATRCSRAEDACHTVEPPVVQVGPSHDVRCLFPFEEAPVGDGGRGR